MRTVYDEPTVVYGFDVSSGLDESPQPRELIGQMDETQLPAQVRQLNKTQLLDRIRDLRVGIQSGAELTRLQRAHLIQLLLLWESYQARELEELEGLLTRLQGVKIQSEAFRAALMWDLAGYPLASAEDRRHTKRNLFASLKGAPPVDAELNDAESVEHISGHDVQRPTRFGAS